MALAGNIQTLVRTGAGTNALTVQQKLVYEAMLIKVAQPKLVLVNEGQRGTIARQSGGFSTNSIKWRKRGLLSAATTALSEGVPPDFVDVTWSEVTTQLAQYGSAMKHSDIVKHAGIDDNVSHFSMALGEQAGLTIHTLIVNELAGSGTLQLGDAVANRGALDANAILDSAEIKKAVRTLELAKVERFPDGYYHAYIHTRQAHDLRSDADWKLVNGQYYAGQEGLVTAEMGRLHGVKFFVSTELPFHAISVAYGGFTNASVNTAEAFIMGPNAFGVRDFSEWSVPRIDPNTGRGVSIYMVSADEPSRDDPIAQFGTLGWKIAFVTKVLDTTRYIRLETSVSA